MPDSTESSDWFQDSSPETLAKEKQRRSEDYARKQQRRVWIPVGKDYDGVFLDDSPRAFHEHNLLINGTRKGNWFTCIARLDKRDREDLRPYWGGCPICTMLNDDPYFIGLCTIMNVTGFTIEKGEDRGKRVGMFRQLLPLKLGGIEWLNKEKKLRKSLIGCKYNFSRMDQKKDPTYGSPSFLEKVDLNADEFKYKTKDGKILSPDAFDYRKVTAPLTHGRLRQICEQILKQKASGGSSSSRVNGHTSGARQESTGTDDAEGGFDTDDEIPF